MLLVSENRGWSLIDFDDLYEFELQEWLDSLIKVKEEQKAHLDSKLQK